MGVEKNICEFGSLDASDTWGLRNAAGSGFMLLVHKFPLNGARTSRRPPICSLLPASPFTPCVLGFFPLFCPVSSPRNCPFFAPSSVLVLYTLTDSIPSSPRSFICLQKRHRYTGDARRNCQIYSPLAGFLCTTGSLSFLCLFQRSRARKRW